MPNERELVTLAFGNYSTLVAAQWANGTSIYDVHHPTLYQGRGPSSVWGVSGPSSAEIRVPRLVMLDAPHSSCLKDLARSEVNSAHSEDEEDHDEEANVPLWAKSNDVVESEEEAAYSKFAARQMRHWRQARERFYSDEDDEEDEEDAYVTRNCDPDGTTSTDRHADPAGGMDQPQSTDMAAHPKHRRLFRQRDYTVPWWKYIRTGIRSDSYVPLHPLHQVGTAGEVPALHSFGYGLANLKSSANNDMQSMSDAIRCQLEDADYLQGLQCFLDGDSLFGGAAHNVLQEVWEDAGSKLPVAAFTTFVPLPAVMQAGATPVAEGIAFADRRTDELLLNRLLATTHLSQHHSAIYLPLEQAHWPQFFARGKEPPPSWLEDDTATAQYVATVADSALFGLRDGAGSVGQTSPAYDLREWGRTIRPMPSMRVAATLGALPLRLNDARRASRGDDLWNFLEDTPLLPGVARDPKDEVDEERLHDGFIPLTHTMDNPIYSEAGRVVGHAVTLRGAGVLPSNIYPSREAMLRYALPLRTATYLPLLTSTNYPLSSTFPSQLLFRTEAELESVHASLPSSTQSVAQALGQADVGTHVLSTYNSGSMLERICAGAKPVLRHRQHLYNDTYGMERDSWSETMEDGLQIADDYRHADYLSDGDDDDNNDW